MPFPVCGCVRIALGRFAGGGASPPPTRRVLSSSAFCPQRLTTLVPRGPRGVRPAPVSGVASGEPSAGRGGAARGSSFGSLLGRVDDVAEADAGRVADILRTVSDERWCAMQRAGRRAYADILSKPVDALVRVFEARNNTARGGANNVIMS